MPHCIGDFLRFFQCTSVFSSLWNLLMQTIAVPFKGINGNIILLKTVKTFL